MDLNEIANSENFTLADFFAVEGAQLSDRVRDFNDYMAFHKDKGRLQYGREITSAPGRQVLVKDPRGGPDREMLMFGSNDYLSLANHPAVVAGVVETVQRLGVGMGGPPLLNGRNSIHRELEAALSELKQKEDTMLYSSGFLANMGWLTALIRGGDLLIYDELNHASLYDGLKLLRANVRFKAIRFRHNDVAHLEEILRTHQGSIGPKNQIFVAVEGVYSMDGDLAPLDQIVRLKQFYDFNLFVDDAHGTGVMGPTGAGTAEHFGVEKDVDLTMGTFSKAFGVTGGFVSGNARVVNYMRYFSRSYMFSAHIPQSTAAAVLAGIKVIRTDLPRLKSLKRNVALVSSGLRDLGFEVRSISAIIPVPIPERIDIRSFSARLDQEGIFANSIEYPAVPKIHQRIRLSIMATHTEEDIARLLQVFKLLSEEFDLF
ncbi:MAG: pyridoxal phosphate-dependent aminotransferase family protein [Bdellovibrionia bacterium]